MIKKIIKIINCIDSSDTEDKFLKCKVIIENFMKTEKPKDKKIYEGLQAYILEKQIKTIFR